MERGSLFLSRRSYQLYPQQDSNSWSENLKEFTMFAQLVCIISNGLSSKHKDVFLWTFCTECQGTVQFNVVHSPLSQDYVSSTWSEVFRLIHLSTLQYM
jgi:hypothetical protein